MNPCHLFSSHILWEWIKQNTSKVGYPAGTVSSLTSFVWPMQSIPIPYNLIQLSKCLKLAITFKIWISIVPWKFRKSGNPGLAFSLGYSETSTYFKPLYDLPGPIGIAYKLRHIKSTGRVLKVFSVLEFTQFSWCPWFFVFLVFALTYPTSVCL